MRRFNFMLNGSRLMMFPFYIGILICVVLLMVKFATVIPHLILAFSKLDGDRPF